jgi:hypothetical protein
VDVLACIAAQCSSDRHSCIATTAMTTTPTAQQHQLSVVTVENSKHPTMIKKRLLKAQYQL